VGLTREDYLLVYHLADNKQKPIVTLDLDAALVGEQPAFNTIAMIKGSENPDEYVGGDARLEEGVSESEAHHPGGLLGQ